MSNSTKPTTPDGHWYLEDIERWTAIGRAILSVNPEKGIAFDAMLAVWGAMAEVHEISGIGEDSPECNVGAGRG